MNMTMDMDMNMGSGSDMGGMDMSMDTCKMDMYWNWYTIDACFISHSWHIRSHAQFAGSCIGIVFLVVIVEFLRRAQREYDRYLLRSYQERQQTGCLMMTKQQQQQKELDKGCDKLETGSQDSGRSVTAAASLLQSGKKIGAGNDGMEMEDHVVKGDACTMSNTCRTQKTVVVGNGVRSQLRAFYEVPGLNFRPTVLQQLVRAGIYGTLFGLGYFLMLLVMYYNGYIFFCLIIGAVLGNFLFGWDNLTFGGSSDDGTCC